MGLLHKPAVGIYHFLNRNKKIIKEQVRSDLEHLDPGGDREEMCERFYVGKLEKTMVVCLAGFVLAGILTVRAGNQGESGEYVLERGGVTDERKEIILEGAYDGKKEEFTVGVMPMQLGDAEIQEKYEEFLRMLPMLICGENTSCLDVRSDMVLLENYEGYPFLVDWKSQNTEVVTSSGKITRTKQDEEVVLSAEISYGEREWNTQIAVLVKAQELSPGEQLHNEILSSLQEAELNSREKQYVILPEQVGDYPVKWRLSGSGPKLWWWLAVGAVGAAVYIMADHDLHSNMEKQREQMRHAYPEIVHKLALYLGAGMTLQGAFGMIGKEYEQKKEETKYIRKEKKQKQESGEENAIYEQILYTCRELKSGVSEMQAYERFGRRTGLQEYIRLSTLMTQNLRKGNASLLSRLREEAQRALTEQVQRGRMLGEQASTKLLVPMVMMLGVVMVMVIIPAFGSIGM